MSSFDDEFEAVTAEVDPAAEFLAKEQEELGDIGEDLGLAPAQEIPAAREEFVGLQDQHEAIPGLESFAENPFAPPAGAPVFLAQEPLAELGAGVAGLSVKEEPEFLKQWKVEQEARLKTKDAEEEVEKEKLKEKAKEELLEWYKRYEVQLEKTKSSNREAESDFVTEVGGMNHIEPGSEWDRVSKHCDFSAKAPGHTKDVSRMRSILLQLKQNQTASKA